MEYCVNHKEFQKIIGKPLKALHYYKMEGDCYWECFYFDIEGKIFELSNSIETVKLYDDVEDLSVMRFHETDSLGYTNASTQYDKRISKVVITNETVHIENTEFELKTTKAITFYADDFIFTIVKDSWVDEGMKIIYGNEWEDRISQFKSNIYDEDTEHSIDKTVDHVTIEVKS